MGAVKVGLVIASIVFLSRIRVLPESERIRCAKAIHQWHIERIHKIDNLAVDGKIKSEMIKFSQAKKTEQLEQICGVK